MNVGASWLSCWEKNVCWHFVKEEGFIVGGGYGVGSREECLSTSLIWDSGAFAPGNFKIWRWNVYILVHFDICQLVLAGDSVWIRIKHNQYHETRSLLTDRHTHTRPIALPLSATEWTWLVYCNNINSIPVSMFMS